LAVSRKENSILMKPIYEANLLALFNNAFNQISFRNRALRLFGTLFLLSTMSFTTSAEIMDSTNIVEKDSVRFWKNSGKITLGFNQNTYNNWAVGGENSISGKSLIDYKLRFEKKKFSFEHNLKLAYGLIGYDFSRIEKTDDRLEASLSFSQKAYQKWTYTSLLTFKSQFTDSYKFPNDSVIVSSFFAPAYLNASLGFNYRPTEKFEMFISPASGKLTMVTNQSLADKGAFGVRKAVLDSTGLRIQEGANLLCEFGINLLTKFASNITDNVDINSTLNLYNNYLDEELSNRWNIDVDWETSVNFTINKYLQTNVFIHFKYDHNINIQQFEAVNGQKVLTGEGPRLQFKESLGIGILYII